MAQLSCVMEQQVVVAEDSRGELRLADERLSDLVTAVTAGTTQTLRQLVAVEALVAQVVVSQAVAPLRKAESLVLD